MMLYRVNEFEVLSQERDSVEGDFDLNLNGSTSSRKVTSRLFTSEADEYMVFRFQDGTVILAVGDNQVVQLPPDFPRRTDTPVKQKLQEWHFLISDVLDTFKNCRLFKIDLACSRRRQQFQ